MYRLYAPWRGEYREPSAGSDKGECVFCKFRDESNDLENFIIKRTKNCYILLNSYPYNAGHLLVIPNKHVKSLEDLEAFERSVLIETVNLAMNFLKRALNPAGFNIGMNLGSKAAGGSVADHIHVHVLPRWYGDTNFLPALSNGKTITRNLKDMCISFRKLIQEYNL